MLPVLLALAVTLADSLPPLVTTAWLAEHLADPGLVVLHIGDQRSRPLYDRGHIPGARFVNPFTDLAAPAVPGGLTLELPGAAQLDSLLEAKGISDGSRVIVYSAGENFTPTSRAFFTLEYAGLRGRVAMLDGGLDTWTREGRPVSTELPAVVSGRFTPALQADMVVDAAWVAARLHRPAVAIVDARTPNFYRGADARQTRVGRIPGAGNLPFNTVIGPDGRFQPADSLRALLLAAGARPGDTVVTYCHIGQQASLAWFAARMLGYRAAIYDGSFQDWSARRELPVDAPPATTRDSLLVSADWLREHLQDSLLVVLHADRGRAVYDTAHIPGARIVTLGRFAVTRNELPTELAPDDSLLALVRGLGIGNQTRVIIYGDPLAAARLFFTFDYLGHADRTALFDGGLEAWRGAGLPVSREEPALAAGGFLPRAWPDLVVSADWINTRLQDSAMALLDARSADEFAGSRPDTTLPRAGHIPGSHNIPWPSLLESGRLKPAATLRALFEAAGTGPRDEVVTTCATGLRASMLFFVSRYLGYRTRMYDGSWAEWSRRVDLPVATGATP